MSSFTRRIQRQQVGIKASAKIVNGELQGYGYAPPRAKFYLGRGSRLGVSNPEARDLVARLGRQERRAVA